MTTIQKYNKRLGVLKAERQSWRQHWEDLAEHILPRRTRFLASKVNKGDKQNQAIINSTATWSARVLASGMMAGITSPARSWFRLTTPDPAMAEAGSVRQWLSVVEERIRTALARSNVYNGLHLTYGDLGVFGTAALYLEEDEEDVIRAYSFPIGQFYLANSSRQRVDTCYRELSMTVAQLEQAFGKEQCSPRVQQMCERGEYDAWIDVVHLIEPNRKYEEGKLGVEGKKYTSVWYEPGAGATSGDRFLKVEGYEEFPVLAPRWSATGEDVYGGSPGMEVLGDVRALQLLEKRKAQAVEKIIHPPMRGPTSLMNTRASLLPGEFTYVDANAPGQAFSPAFEINPAAVSVADASIREHEQRIKTGFYADLWLMMASQGPSDMTAREVSERHEEKMLQLGPVMERLQDELLDPLIERVFGILLRKGQIPPPPPELEGNELRVEYLSIMAQAQKLLGTSSIERLASFAGNLAAVNPNVLDKMDFDEALDSYSLMLGTPPGIVRTDEQVAAIRKAKAQAAQQQQQAMAMQQAAQGAQTLSQADLSGDNALSRLLGNLGGTAAAQAGYRR